MANPDAWGLSWGGGGVAQGIWGVSWGGFGSSPPPGTVPVYGQPFITMRSELFDKITGYSKVITTIDFESIIDEDE